MLLCTEVMTYNGIYRVGILDTDDFRFERFNLVDLKPYIESGMSIYGIDIFDSSNYRKVQIGLLKYMQSVGGYVETEDLIILMPNIDIEANIYVRNLHIWFKGYYYKFQYMKDGIHDNLCIGDNVFFRNAYSYKDIRNIFIDKDESLCVQLHNNFFGYLYDYTSIYLSEGHIIFRGKRKRNFKGKPMSKESFKRKVLVGGI